MLRHWTPALTLCIDGPSDLARDQRRQLAALGVRVVATPVVRLEGRAEGLEGLMFGDGSSTACEALFLHPPQRQRSALPAELGCALTEEGYVAVSEHGETSIPGVYAVGDMASPLQQVAFAAAAMMLHGALVFADAERGVRAP